MQINELSNKSGITKRAIRYYEELNLIESTRLKNNYRFYNNETLDKVKFISRARKLGFSIGDCAELIKLFSDKNRKSAEVRKIAITKNDVLKKQIKELKDLQNSLQWLINKCPGDGRPDCPILDELSS